MPVIEYVYSAHSAFAYLGSRELMQICADHSATLVHKPVLLSPVIEAQGGLPFRMRTQKHVDYFFGREIERWSEFRSVPIMRQRPIHHDADYSLASGMIIALGETGALADAMAHGLLEAHWCNDADLSDSSTLMEIATELGHDANLLLESAASKEIQNKLQENTDWARDREVFGSPTYIVDGDPFYGQDRLDHVKRALVTPFKASSWSNPSVN
ncbi:2-hydroxychromene-2-carboxylate isomerase [Roseibium sp. SCP14]|uniref:2-hydroxychromene-2-carboxylate isomerase n=1 Tax=Roseibium sp. SCP14 TaxID=3141375 RepID=UPI003338036F